MEGGGEFIKLWQKTTPISPTKAELEYFQKTGIKLWQVPEIKKNPEIYDDSDRELFIRR